MKDKKLYLVVRDELKGTPALWPPVYYYTFAESEEDAIMKVRLKWGEILPKTFAREIKEKDLDSLVIATNHY
jgi:hypothetical protein